MRATVVGVLALLGAVGSAAEADWQIPARTLSSPQGASSALQEAVAQTPAPPVTERKAFQPSSAEEWRAMIAQFPNQTELEALASQANVAIEAGKIGGVASYRVAPNGGARPPHQDHVFLYIHGGAYVFGGGDAAVPEAAVISAFAGIPSVAVDYRMPPDHPFPAAVDDVVAVYRELLEDHAPGQIAIGGTSAGGGLSLAAIHQFKALELPVPGAVYLGTPWADLTDTSDSLHTLEGIDRILVTYDGMLASAAKLYAAGTPLTDPLISPVYGDFTGFPPTYLVTGTRDMLLSDTARVHRKLKAAGVVADLNVYEGLSHAEYMMLVGSPENLQTYGELAQFLAAHLE
ncbi:MAG: alpha/beta hydrolase [Gammaproteobacteria bacterium]|nr:alpha/beta hydrolase [Gammaproteobacteria bacterium]